MSPYTVMTDVKYRRSADTVKWCAIGALLILLVSGAIDLHTVQEMSCR